MISFNPNNLIKQFNNIYLKSNGIIVHANNKSSAEKNVFTNLLNAEIQNNNTVSKTPKVNTFDLKRVEQYYNGTYYEKHPYGSYNPDKDYMGPVAVQTVNGDLVFFPPKDASDNVKRAFFSGSESMDLEDRKRVRAKIVSRHNAVLVSTSKHLGVDWRELNTTESWNSIYGNNISYQDLFESFVNHFKNSATIVSNTEEKTKLSKNQAAHQLMLDTFIEYGVK